jgi:hypothetical protein
MAYEELFIKVWCQAVVRKTRMEWKVLNTHRHNYTHTNTTPTSASCVHVLLICMCLFICNPSFSDHRLGVVLVTELQCLVISCLELLSNANHYEY